MVPVGMLTASRDVGERVESVRRLTLFGFYAREIARQVGISERTVQRYRARLRQTGRLPR